MIQVHNLTKEFNGQKVLNDLSLDISQGELFVILGRSGTGKSVLLKHLIGLLKPDFGTIYIDHIEITTLSEQELLKVRQHMGYLFQEGALYDFMSVYENIAFPLMEHTDMKPKEIKKRVQEVLALVDLSGVEDKMPSELSGGMKKRTGLARAIALTTKVLFCDEPTSGLDPIRSRDISDLIRNISKKLNCTTIITSHDIDNTLRIADRVAILEEGKIIALGTPKEIQDSKIPFVQEFVQNV